MLPAITCGSKMTFAVMSIGLLSAAYAGSRACSVRTRPGDGGGISRPRLTAASAIMTPAPPEWLSTATRLVSAWFAVRGYATNIFR